MNCVYCGKTLSGKRTKFCSSGCSWREWKSRNIEWITEYAKKYYEDNKAKRLANTHQWIEKHPGYASKIYYKNIEYHNKYRQEYKVTHKEENRARTALSHAVRDGKIIRPTKCERCDCECHPDGHHLDYNKPLDVIWLCQSCHREEHGNHPAFLEDKNG